jgi:AraC family transcriptional regulator of adaptative response/methylated-DNA-[protein]-cysteine methyltransferase
MTPADDATMLPIDDDSLYAALLARDRAYDGLAYVGVTSTGIFCRLTCPARKPARTNTRFFATAAEAEGAGFRACLRCRPKEGSYPMSEVVRTLRERVAARPDQRWTDKELAELGLDASTVRRAFRRDYGVTFAQYARQQRLGRALTTLARGGPVIEAQLDGGYESGSGFREAVARAIGASPARARGRRMLTARWFETPLGTMLGVADDEGIHLLEFSDRKDLPRELERLSANVGPVAFGDHLRFDALAAWLDRYFQGDLAPHGLELAIAGTPFQQRVWDELRAIPPGETRSYGGLALSLGSPSAVRAIAAANGANQLAILVPCHRVIGSDGKLVGYAGGLWRKKWLLEHERRSLGQPAGAGPLLA